MRQSMIVLAFAGAVISPAAFAQSAHADARSSTAVDTNSTPRAVEPTSKAHRAMASFNSLLREAALQSQAAQRAAASTQPAEQPARAASDDRETLASTPDPAAVH